MGAILFGLMYMACDGLDKKQRSRELHRAEWRQRDMLSVIRYSRRASEDAIDSLNTLSPDDKIKSEIERLQSHLRNLYNGKIRAEGKLDSIKKQKAAVWQ